MGVAYYIVLNNDNPGFDAFVNGKAIAQAIQELARISERHGLAKLEDFMGQSMSDLAELAGEDIDVPEGEGELWFEPEAGIALIDTLTENIRLEPRALTSPDAVLKDLEEYRRVLAQAQTAGLRWHLALDF